MRVILTSNFGGQMIRASVCANDTETISECIKNNGMQFDDDCSIFANGAKVSPGDIVGEYDWSHGPCYVTIVSHKKPTPHTCPLLQ